MSVTLYGRQWGGPYSVTALDVDDAKAMAESAIDENIFAPVLIDVNGGSLLLNAHYRGLLDGGPELQLVGRGEEEWIPIRLDRRSEILAKIGFPPD